MNYHAIIHEPKSNMSYAFDNDTLHIRLKTARGEVKSVKVNALDQFDMKPNRKGEYVFNLQSIKSFKMIKEYETELFDIWFVEIKDFPWRRIRYAFTIEGYDESVFLGSQGVRQDVKEFEKKWFSYFNFPYINGEDVHKKPAWVKDTVWYQIFPERFRRNASDDGFLAWGDTNNDIPDIKRKYGGDLKGIIESLDYIKSMGFSGIYFTPIFESPSTHKYDTIDYFKIDPQFGTNEDFKMLVEEAHRRDIKVMLDAVFNHCGDMHPFWQDVLKNGVNSEYIDYFCIFDKSKPILSDHYDTPYDINFRTFAFTTRMPKWNTENKKVREHLLRASKYWIEEFDIDGWRLDVSNEVSHDFWREFRKEVHSVKEDVYILGENWDNSYPWLMGDQMDAVMNYGFSDPVWNLLACDSYKKEPMSGEQFKFAINKLLSSYPISLNEAMFNLLDSHDTPRIMTVCGENRDRTMLAYVIQMTMAGSPSIYYGGEIAMTGDGENNRKCMVWEAGSRDDDFATELVKLISLRKEYEAFKNVHVEWILTDETGVIYKKSGKEDIYVAINYTENEQNYCLNSGKYVNIITGDKVGESFTLKPFGYAIFKK